MNRMLFIRRYWAPPEAATLDNELAAYAVSGETLIERPAVSMLEMAEAGELEGAW